MHHKRQVKCFSFPSTSLSPLKSPQRRNNLIQIRHGGDGAALPADLLRCSALCLAGEPPASGHAPRRRPVCCHPTSQEQSGAAPARRGRPPAQLLLTRRERGFWQCSSVVAKNIFYEPNSSSFPSLQSQSCPPECVVRCCSLLTGVLAAYVSTGCLTEEEASHSQLFAKARVSFENASTSLRSSSECVESSEGGDIVFCLGVQALAQELSGFVSSVKVRMTEEGTMTALASVMRLCTQSASRRCQVRHCLMQGSPTSLTP